MSARKLGTSLVGVGATTLVLSLLIDWFRYVDDDALAQSEAIFDFGVPTHVLFFAATCIVGIGALVLAFGERILSGTNAGPKVLAGVFVIALIGVTAAVADSSSYSKPAEMDHHAEDTTATTSGADHQGDDATPTTAANHDMDHGDVAIAAGEVIPGTADGTSPCEISSPTPASPGQAGSGDGGQEGQAAGDHGHRGLVKQFPLSNAERETLIVQMAQARTVIDEFPTVADALAAGYKESTVFVPCIGAHYTNISRVPGFNPAAPSELLYEGTDPTSRIIGLSYLVLDASGVPEGFAGANDIWHQHNANGGLCLDENFTVVAGENATEEECIARGGKKSGELMKHIWMTHAWVAPGWDCSWGVFAGECPELGGKLGGTAQS